MKQDPNLTIGTFRPGESSRWQKIKLVSLIKFPPLKDGIIQSEKSIECKYKI